MIKPAEPGKAAVASSMKAAQLVAAVAVGLAKGAAEAARHLAGAGVRGQVRRARRKRQAA